MAVNPGDLVQQALNKQKGWAWFEVALPVGIVLAIWLWQVADIPNAFYMTFFDGDLHLFGGMLFLGVAADLISQAWTDSRLRSPANFSRVASTLALGVFLFVLYGLTKNKSFSILLAAPPNPISDQIKLLAYVSTASALFAICWCSVVVRASTRAIIAASRIEGFNDDPLV